MFKAGIASNKEKACKVFGVDCMLKKKNYKVQEALGMLNCPRKLAYSILNTEAGANLIILDAMDLSWKVDIKDMNPKGLRSTAGTPLRVNGSIWVATQIKQQVNDTDFLVV